MAEIEDAFKQKYKSPLLYSPTGSGKTVILSHIADRTSAKGKNCCILVHRQELVIQTAMTLAKSGVEHRICASPKVVQIAQAEQLSELGKSFYRYEATVTVASVQSLVHNMHDFPHFDLMLIDEAHHGVAGTWRKIVDTYNTNIIGFSATPQRLDGQGLGVDCGGIYDVLLMGPTVQTLIDEGYLCPPRVFAPPSQMDLKGVRTRCGDYAREELSQRVNKVHIIGDVVNHYTKLCPNVPSVAFCVSVDHARHVAELFNSAGYRSACVDGTMSDASRRAAIKGLASGRLHVLTSCDIISEGTDIPVMGAALLMRPTKSLGLYLQQVGRALRPYPGKEFAIILDHVGNVKEHGMPEDDRAWSLQGTKKRGSRDKEYFGPPVRQCLECYALFPVTVDICPLCGNAVNKSQTEIKQLEAELVEIQKVEVKKQKRMAAYEQSQADSLEKLIEIGIKRGYKNPAYWAKNVYKGRKKQGGSNGI